MHFLKILVLVIGTFGLTNCSGHDGTKKETKTPKELLLKAIDRFNTAFQEGNTIVLESMITENYVHTNGNSKAIGKKDWLNYLNKRENAIKSGNLEVVGYDIEETEIEFHGNVAIVTGKVIVSNKENGEIQKNAYRITNVWVHEAGNWKRAGFHDGKIR